MVTPPLNLKKMNHPKLSETKRYLGHLYAKARDHITGILSSLPASVTDGLDDVTTFSKGKTAVEALESNLEELRGKRANHELRLKKRKIKSRLRKKKIKEELRQKKLELMKAKMDNESLKAGLESSEVQFNKLEFDNEDSSATKKKFSKKERPRVERDPETALKRIEGLSHKISKLTEAGDKEKAEEIAMNDKWKCALLKAEGLKVKDNPTLLKKSIKKRQNKKNKSAQKWKERTDLVEKKKEEAQKKRKENILKKKKEKKSNKIKKSVKKGRVVI